jgi:hypothetical protein
MLKWSSYGFTYYPTGNRDTGFDHCLAIAADEIMPIRERFSSRSQSIGTGFRQPVYIVDNPQGQSQTIRNKGFPIAVIAASRRFSIEQFAGDICMADCAAIGIFDFMKATPAAAIAKRLPFGARQIA